MGVNVKLRLSVCRGRGVVAEEKTRFETKISELEDELEEEQSNTEQLNDRVRRLTAQVRHFPLICYVCR